MTVSHPAGPGQSEPVKPRDPPVQPVITDPPLEPGRSRDDPDQVDLDPNGPNQIDDDRGDDVEESEPGPDDTVRSGR